MRSDGASELLRRGVTVDLTLPWGPPNENKEPTLARYESAVDFVSLTVGTDWMSLDETVRHIAAERARFLSQPERFSLAGSVQDIREAKREGKLAVGFHFQGSNPLVGDTNLVGLFYELGVRHILFAYNVRNRAGDGCHERTDGGLSRFGVQLVEEMNRVGMLVDCTHTGYRTTMEMMETSSSPTIFSHSCARSLWDHERNIRDEQIVACAQTGGVIGINGVGFFLADNDASPEQFVRHVDYVATLVGPQHVALGLDYVYYMDSMLARWRASPGRYGEGYPQPPWHFLPPEEIPRIVDLLIERGWSDELIYGLLGENFLRVAEAVWR